MISQQGRVIHYLLDIELTKRTARTAGEHDLCSVPLKRTEELVGKKDNKSLRAYFQKNRIKENECKMWNNTSTNHPLEDNE